VSSGDTCNGTLPHHSRTDKVGVIEKLRINLGKPTEKKTQHKYRWMPGDASGRQTHQEGLGGVAVLLHHPAQKVKAVRDCLH